MEDQLPEKQPHVYHVQQEAFVHSLSKLGFFVGLETGFIDYDARGSLIQLSNGTFVSMIPGVKAAYYVPDPGEDDGLFSNLLDILYGIVDNNIGVYFSSNSGYRWVIFDTAAYAELCKTTDFEPDEFRVYPQQDI